MAVSPRAKRLLRRCRPLVTRQLRKLDIEHEIWAAHRGDVTFTYALIRYRRGPWHARLSTFGESIAEGHAHGEVAGGPFRTKRDAIKAVRADFHVRAEGTVPATCACTELAPVAR